MSPTLHELKLTLSQLSPPDRSELIDFLLDSFDVSEDEARIAWREEVSRRMADIRAGKVQGIPAEEVLAQLREAYP